MRRGLARTNEAYDRRLMTEASKAERPVETEKKKRLFPRIPTSLLVTLLGIALTAWLFPAFTRQWEDRQKAADLKASILDEIARGTASAFAGADSLAHGDGIIHTRNLNPYGAPSLEDQQPHAVAEGRMGDRCPIGRPIQLGATRRLFVVHYSTARDHLPCERAHPVAGRCKRPLRVVGGIGCDRRDATRCSVDPLNHRQGNRPFERRPSAQLQQPLPQDLLCPRRNDAQLDRASRIGVGFRQVE